MTARAIILASAVAAATACVKSPSYEGLLCGEGNACPESYGCDPEHRCRKTCAEDTACTSDQVCLQGLCMAPTMAGTMSPGSGDPSAIMGPSMTPRDPGSGTTMSPATGGHPDGGVLSPGEDANPISMVPGPTDASVVPLPGIDASDPMMPPPQPDASDPMMPPPQPDASDPMMPPSDPDAGFAPDATPPPDAGFYPDAAPAIDPATYVHNVVCSVFDNGYTNQSANSDAVYMHAAMQACVPSGATGNCHRWFGRCTALPAPDGHTHQVFFLAFDDGYTNPTGGSDAIYMSAAYSACTPGGATGVCRRWFGRGYTSVTEGHSHSVACEAFDDGYTNPTGLSDAVLYNGSQLCVPGGATGICRKWFGRCVTR